MRKGRLSLRTFPEKEGELVGMIGQTQFNDVLNYAFEYACSESRYLRLWEFSSNPEEYFAAFSKLCTIRRQICVEEVWDVVTPKVRKARLKGEDILPISINLDYSKIGSNVIKRYKGLSRP